MSSASSSTRPLSSSNGMTLVELMIVLVVLSVLAAIAWPSYQSAVQRSRRADGMAALTQIMQAQERWRANNPEYKGSLTGLPGTRATSADGHYTLAVAALVEGETTQPLGIAYQASATAKSTSPQYADVNCRVLRVTVNGGNIKYRSSNSAGTANGDPDPCWAR